MNITEERFANIELDDKPKKGTKARTEAELVKEIAGEDIDTNRVAGATIIGARQNAESTDYKGTHVDKFQYKDWEKMPSIGEACNKLAKTIESEKRISFPVDIKNMRVNDDGRVRFLSGNVSTDQGPVSNLTLTENAWKQLVKRAPKDIPRHLRSNVNSWLSGHKGSAVCRSMKIVADSDKNKKTRRAFAFVSDKYVPHDANEVALKIAEALPKEVKGSVRYAGDGGRYEIQAILARPFDVDGDIHRVKVCLRSADFGGSSQKFLFKIWRMRCSNGMYVSDQSLIKRVPHVGNIDNLHEQFAEGLDLANHAIESFGHQWKRANSEQFTCKESGDKLHGLEALKRLAVHRTINVPYERKERMYRQFESAWNKEPGDSRAHVLNAVTRAAHESTWKSQWYQEELEEQAGKLLYNYVTLSPITPAQSDALS